jgi:flagellar biosynthesis protein FliP
VVDRARLDPAHAASRPAALHDSYGPVAGRLSLSQAGAGHADGSIQPVMLQVDQQALAPYRAGTISGEEALKLGAAPVKTYMLRYARQKDLALFASAGMAERPKAAQDLPMQVVVPAYMLSELKAGFQIGAVLFLPFLLIDLAIASVTTSVGMMQLPPVVISTPVKILLFVMVDGWSLLAGSLLKSF